MTQLELERPRDVGALFRDAFGVFARHAWLFIAVSAAVVIPVELVVLGIGMEMLTSSYDDSANVAELVVPAVVEFVVVVPIITAICIYALQALAAGERPRAGRVLVEGFEAFTPLFGAVALAAIGIAVGLLALIVPGVFLAVRWFFVPQAVVIDDARGTGALRRSGDLVQGFWWRTFGMVLLANIAIAIPGLLLVAPFTGLAESSDRAVWELVGTTITTIVTTPFVALYATLLYYDLRARRSDPAY